MPASGEWFRDAFDEFYLSVYRHRDRGEAERFLRWAAPRFRVDGARVLDLACGAARFAGPVRHAGGRYLGLDLSPPLLRAARGNETAPDLVRADMRRLPFADASVDVVLSMFTSFGYFGDQENRGVVRAIARILVPGGRLVLDHMNAGAVRRTLVPGSERREGSFRIRERRSIQADRVVKDVEVIPESGETRRYRESVRLLDEATLVAWAREAGLEPLGTWGDYDAAPFTLEAPRLLIAFGKESP